MASNRISSKRFLKGFAAVGFQKTLLLPLLAGALLLSGCTFLPSSGTSRARIHKEAGNDQRPGPYQLIPLNESVVNTLNAANVEGAQRSSKGNQRSINKARNEESLAIASQRLLVGDVVNVTIYSAGGGLFGSSAPSGSAPNPSTQLPTQIIDQTGEITVPYAGRVPAKGKTPHEIEQLIVDRLKTKVVEPQVIVSIGERLGGNLVTVTGAVKGSARVPVDMNGSRVLDAITVAGGSTGPAFETLVTVTRGSQSRSDYLEDIFSTPSKNILLLPNDTVVLRHSPRSFQVFGATGRASSFPFENQRISLAEALGKAGGLDDNRANPTQVYLYRMEHQRVLSMLKRKPARGGNGAESPVIYQLDLRSPEGLFYAQNFLMRDRDIVIILNAGSVGLTKALNLVNSITGPARTGISTAAGLDSL